MWIVEPLTKLKLSRFPIPQLEDTIDELVGYQWFSKMDLCCGYHQIGNTLGDKWKKTFKT